MKFQKGAGHLKLTTINRLMEMLEFAERQKFLAVVPYIEQAIRNVIADRK